MLVVRTYRSPYKVNNSTVELQVDRYSTNHIKDIANYILWKVALGITVALLHTVSS